LSLKIFHIIFIIFADLLAVGMAVWSWIQYKSLAWVVLSVLCSLGLNAYLFWFWKKSKNFK